MRIAAQLYTLREFLKTPADIAATLSRVAKIGYEAVQLSAVGPIAPADLKNILDENELAVAATHVSQDRMTADPQAVIDDHKLWACTLTAIGGFHKGATLADWDAFIAAYNAIAPRFAAAGLPIGYHNHSHELMRLDGEVVLDRLIRRLDKSVWFEIDTYWITHGGGDPAQWIRKCKGRLPAVHFKDMQISTGREQQMAVIGEGNLNWPEITRACHEAGTKWVIIEQDNCNGQDPFDCLARSLAFTRKLLGA